MNTHKCEEICYVLRIDNFSLERSSATNFATPFRSKTCDLELQLSWSTFIPRYPVKTAKGEDVLGYLNVRLHSESNTRYEGMLKCCLRGDRENKYYSSFKLPKRNHSDHFMDFELCSSLERYLLNGQLAIYCDINGKCEQFGKIDKGIEIFDYKLANDFATLYLTKDMADVTIITDDNQKILAHKLILSARSNVFAAMFRHQMKESSENSVTISDVSYGALDEMLRYIYTGRHPTLKEMNDLIDLIAAAEKYQLEELKKICEKSMSSFLSTESAAGLLKTADLYNMDKLKIETIKFIKANIHEVKETSNWVELLTTDRELIMESFMDPIYLKRKPNDDQQITNQNKKSKKGD